MPGGTHSTLMGTNSNDTLEAHIDGATTYDIVRGKAGDDTITVNLPSAGPATLYGDAGDDTVTGGDGDDALYGGTGTDTLNGGAGDDRLYIMAGDLASGEVYNGGTGFDVLSYTGATAIDLSGVTIAGLEVLSSSQHAAFSLTVAELDSFTNLNGLGDVTMTTGGAVDLSGGSVTVGAFHLSSAGNTLTLTGDHSDGVTGYTVIGGAGGDTVNGGALGDTISGGDGNDTLNGAEGGDTLTGGAGKDALNGGIGDDTLVILAASDLKGGEVYDGGDGTDTLRVDATGLVNLSGVTVVRVESLTGGASTEVQAHNGLLNALTNINVGTLDAMGSGAVDLHGDTVVVDQINLQGVYKLDLTGDLNGGAGGYLVVGGALSETVLGGTGGDTLVGAGGDDLLTGGPGDDTLNGGTGVDTANYSTAPGVVTVNLLLQGGAQDTGAGGMDTLIAIENVTGGSSGDTLLGDGGNNVLSGGGGDDILKGGPGNDTLNGGDGNDRLSGNAGDNVMNGGDGDDIMSAPAGTNTFSGGLGYDTVDDSTYTSALTIDLSLTTAQNTGAAGVNTFLGVEHLIAGSGDDHLTGHGGSLLEGRGGNDTLDVAFGSPATLMGGDGDDIINGGPGGDVLIGGAGHDELTGGMARRNGALAHDVFVFNDVSDSAVGAGRDHITDFYLGVSKIDLSAIDANTTAADDQAFTFIGTNAFSGVAGQLHYVADGAAVTVEGDVDGDGAADFQIEVDFFNANHVVTVNSFIL